MDLATIRVITMNVFKLVLLFLVAQLTAGLAACYRNDERAWTNSTTGRENSGFQREKCRSKAIQSGIFGGMFFWFRRLQR